MWKRFQKLIRFLPIKVEEENRVSKCLICSIKKFQSEKVLIFRLFVFKAKEAFAFFQDKIQGQKIKGAVERKIVFFQQHCRRLR